MAPKFVSSLLVISHTSHVHELSLLIGSRLSTDQVKTACLHQSALVVDGAFLNRHTSGS